MTTTSALDGHEAHAILNTRMVRLSATAAVEYVAACWVSGAGGFLSRGSFARGTFSLGSFARGAYARSPKFNAYTHRPGFLCLAS